MQWLNTVILAFWLQLSLAYIVAGESFCIVSVQSHYTFVGYIASAVLLMHVAYI